MSEKTLLKKAFIAAFCEHPSISFYKKRLFDETNLENLATQLIEAGEKITKADFLSKNEQGEYFLDTAAGWRNLKKISDFIQKNGEVFSAEDFLTVIGNKDKSFLDSAAEKEGLLHLFNPEIWRGRYQDIEKIYYNMPHTHRQAMKKSIDLVDVKRKIYRAEGKVIREDQLAELNIDWREFPKVFAHGADGIVRLRSIANKLERNGLHLTKEDILFPDDDGDSFFYYADAWKNLETIANMIGRSGEQFEVEDFISKRNKRVAIIDRAAEYGALGQVFHPTIWGDRIQDMMRLWSLMAPYQQASLGYNRFVDCIANAENRVYGGLLNADNNIDIKDIKQPIAIDGNVKTYPLGLISTWKKWDEISAVLRQKKQKLSKADLARNSGYLNRPVYDIAIRSGHLNKIVATMVEHQIQFEPEELLRSNHLGQNILLEIARRGELAMLFTPKLWIGRVNDMKALWSQVQIEHKQQVDWPQILSETQIGSLKRHSKPQKLKRRKK